MAVLSVPLAPKKSGVVTFLHITDLHFTSATKLDKPNKAEFLKRFEQLIRERARPIDLLFVTGDLVDNAQIGSLPLPLLIKVRDYLFELCEICKVCPSCSMIIVPGNHDYKWNGIFFKSKSRDTFNSVFSSFCSHRLYPEMGLVIGCFDSNDVRYPWEMALGNVDMTAFDELENELGRLKVPDTFARLALVHHHPMPVPKAEVLRPQTWFEKILRRKVVSSPEMMLLRNSGIFIRRLLKHRFKVVLHGHLHFPGYSRLVEDAKCIEVISGASMGAPPAGGDHSFIIGTIAAKGYLDAERINFDEAGNVEECNRIATASYELLRANGWCEPQSLCEELAVCDLHHKQWQVVLPEGDLITTEKFYGLRALTDKPIHRLPLVTQSRALLRMNISVKSLNPAVSARVVEPDSKDLAGDEFRYFVEFNPPLSNNTSTDLVCRRMAFGAVFGSTEGQKLWGVPKNEHGTESCELKIRFACRRLLTTVRFSTSGLHKVPDPIQHEVRDLKKQLTPQEQDSSGLMFSSWNPSCFPHESEFLPSPNAVMAVDGPQLGYTYSLRWMLPDVEPVENQTALDLIRRKVFEIRRSETKQDVASGFLAWCLHAIQVVVREESGVKDWRDPSLNACLLGFDGQQLKEVVTRRRSQLSQTTIQWGRDVIGTAFRRGAAQFFGRSVQRRGDHHRHNVPEEIEYLLAYPLYCVKVDGYPTACIALTSSDPHSGVKLFVQPQKMPPKGTQQEIADRRLGKMIFFAWREICNQLLDLQG